ncbi:hypothetical protein SETIT_2G359700v2 [Setaria italica]|uniref:Uncharacterized protein n=2 Tax=Setaria TaxID=4554 RepID=A0A368Q6Y4_SETIT|nr:hypothetical protein SETIT_2G359700v2 [Setaria italica]TKW35415.1 hypothetical protein SEVIR_2G370500v2 [Setaria viridis]
MLEPSSGEYRLDPSEFEPREMPAVLALETVASRDIQQTHTEAWKLQNLMGRSQKQHQAIISSWSPKLHHHMAMQIRELDKNPSKYKKLQTLAGILALIC